MQFLGDYRIDDYVTFGAQLHRFSSGAVYAPTGNVTYTFYENNATAGAPTGGNLAQLNSKTGLYTARVQLTAANGFEAGKEYLIHIEATVDSVAAAELLMFRIVNNPKVDLDTIKTQAVTCGADTTVGAYVGNATAALAVNGSGQVTVASLANNSITAAAIANGAIDNATFASDVGSTAYATNIIALAARKAIDDYDPLTKAEMDAAQAAVKLANGAHGGAATVITLQTPIVANTTLIEGGDATNALNAATPASVQNIPVDGTLGVTLANRAHGGAAATLTLGGEAGLTADITGSLSGATGKSPATLAAGDVTGNLPADIKAYTVQPTVTGATLHADYNAAKTAAPATTALSNATWTDARASKLDNLSGDAYAVVTSSTYGLARLWKWMKNKYSYNKSTDHLYLYDVDDTTPIFNHTCVDDAVEATRGRSA